MGTLNTWHLCWPVIFICVFGHCPLLLYKHRTSQSLSSMSGVSWVMAHWTQSRIQCFVTPGGQHTWHAESFYILFHFTICVTIRYFFSYSCINRKFGTLFIFLIIFLLTVTPIFTSTINFVVKKHLKYLSILCIHIHESEILTPPVMNLWWYFLELCVGVCSFQRANFYVILAYSFCTFETFFFQGEIEWIKRTWQVTSLYQNFMGKTPQFNTTF